MVVKRKPFSHFCQKSPPYMTPTQFPVESIVSKLKSDEKAKNLDGNNENK
jgi:hypothetical protein